MVESGRKRQMRGSPVTTHHSLSFQSSEDLICSIRDSNCAQPQSLETNMTERRYPNESREYRDARDALLKDEQELIDKVKSVAARRRELPLGGELKDDYVFQWANDGKVGRSVKFSELFGDKKIGSCFNLSCSDRTGTSPVHHAHRLSMGSIELGIR